MEDWFREMKLAFRSLARRPAFSALAILTLALGIGANTAIFSVIEGSLLRPLPYADTDRLVWLSDGHENFGGAGVDQSVPNLMDLRAESRLLASSAIYTDGNSNIATAESPERVRVLRTSSEMLSVLGVTPPLGRDLLPEDDLAGAPFVAVLTDELWRRWFGADPGIVGRTITVDAAPVQVVGVAPPSFTFPRMPEVIMPLQHVRADLSRGWRSFNAVGRLAPGAELAGLRVELQGIFDRLVAEYPEQNDGWFTWADPLREYATGRNLQSLLLLAGGVLLVLLIACVNVANLLIVRAENRHREFAIRQALGAGRARLLPHFLSEGLVLSLTGGALGMVAARWGVDVLVALYGGSLQRADQIALNGTALAFGLAVSLGVGLLVGLVPLIRTRSKDLHGSLKEGARGSSARGSRLGRGLVMAEVALAVVIVVGAGLLTNSLWRLQQVELGVEDVDRVLTFQISLPSVKYPEGPDIRGFFDPLLLDLERVSGVQAVGLVNRLPLLGGSNVTNFPVFGDPERVAHFVSMRSVTPGYFDAVGVPLLAGRWLDVSEFADENINSILINETLSRQLFGGEDPLGKLVGPDWTEDGLEVVGVVGDIVGGSPTRPAPPAIYYPLATDTDRELSVLVKTAGDPMALLPIIQQAVKRLDPEVPIFQVRTLEEIARARLGTRRFAMSLFGVFAGLALLLGAVGIYGVMSFAVAQRARELGVRIALGASRGSVMRLVLSQGARLTFPGVIIGLLLALASGRVLGSLLFEVSALDPLTYGAVAVVLALVSMAATGVPAFRATRVDPIASIRDE
ncbi:ABC transporter permease [Gemmatimonadota bacterium]